MRRLFCLCSLVLASVPALAASKTHVISFGKWQLVKAHHDGDMESVGVRVRPLLVDGKVKEYTIGQPHEVTERVFVVATAFRINDTLPNENESRWIWQCGGWVEVDRSSGRITPLKLPNFDPQLSIVSWYRDYIAYCGVSEHDARSYVIVMQLRTRKPVLRKEVEKTAKSASADPLCRAPIWQRKPIRVDFNIANGPNLTFTIQPRTLEMTAAEQDDTD